MKKFTKTLLVLLTALCLILTCGCGVSDELAGSLAETVNAVKDEAVSTIQNTVNEYMDSTGASEHIDAAMGNDSSEDISEDAQASETDSYEEDGTGDSSYAEDESSDSSYTEDESSETAAESIEDASVPDTQSSEISVTEDGEYSDKEHVALYIYTYGHLPSNYVTKKEAENAGWDSSSGNLNIVLPGKSIGGNKFGNREGLLPEASGRTYYECDVNYNPDGITDEPVYRGSERIIYSSDGHVYYTNDHYASFEQLY